jgi:DNA repair photolyase
LSRLKVGEVRCKTLLHRLDFGSTSEVTANFYRGCSHGCVYCYVPSLIHDERDWGSYVDAKVNAVEVLDRETRHMKPTLVFLSSATDPYQPVEARYRLTRRCLELLHRRGFPVTILTRSPLVLRDIDLLKKFEWVRVGVSISTVPERRFEPGVVPLERRIECLRRLAAEGIKTWVSLAPIIPGQMLVDLESLVETLRRAGVSAVFPGLLRFQNYEISRMNFERTTGFSMSEMLREDQQTLERAKLLIEQHGLEASASTMEWEPRGDETRLDSFLGNVV